MDHLGAETTTAGSRASVPGLTGQRRWRTFGCVRCFACDARIELASGESVGFRASCDACGADLHACRNCAHHDPAAYNQCRESNAERVLDSERGNRCDYFTPGSGRGGDAPTAKVSAKNALDALFKKS
jgi:hypothetical protein